MLQTGPATGGGSAARINNAPVKPSLPASTSAGKVPAPNLKANAAPTSPVAAAASAPAPPKEPEPPPNREEVQGTLYTNFSHGFRMYKAPSWGLIEDARQALPNAIVAMGTSNESTLMVVGQEKATGLAREVGRHRGEAVKGDLRKLPPALASERRWWVERPRRSTNIAERRRARLVRTLVVIGRGKDVLTMLGMTYADSDLIRSRKT
jgi:hypothetical protein